MARSSEKGGSHTFFCAHARVDHLLVGDAGLRFRVRKFPAKSKKPGIFFAD